MSNKGAPGVDGLTVKHICHGSKRIGQASKQRCCPATIFRRRCGQLKSLRQMEGGVRQLGIPDGVGSSDPTGVVAVPAIDLQARIFRIKPRLLSGRYGGATCAPLIIFPVPQHLFKLAVDGRCQYECAQFCKCFDDCMFNFDLYCCSGSFI